MPCASARIQGSTTSSLRGTPSAFTLFIRFGVNTISVSADSIAIPRRPIDGFSALRSAWAPVGFTGGNGLRYYYKANRNYCEDRYHAYHSAISFVRRDSSHNAPLPG
jgi:hypothetical protein